MTPIDRPWNQPWWQLTCEVAAAWGEDAAACLMEAGALGVQIIDAGPEPRPAFAKHAVTPRSPLPPPGQALLIASYDIGNDGAHLAPEAAVALSSLGLTIDPATMDVVRRHDTDWAERWKQYFKPLKIGRRMWIVPTWEQDFRPPTGSLVLHLDPGMAFGTGQHASTAMCLRAIEQWSDSLPARQRAAMRLLDLGCGSGVLAIGACKLGLGHATALDVDPEAVRATQDNAAQNGVAEHMTIAATPIDQVTDSFNFIVANILAAPLIDMAAWVVRRLQAGGTLVLSGILVDGADEVLQAYINAARRLGKELVTTHRWTHQEWAALAFIQGST